MRSIVVGVLALLAVSCGRQDAGTGITCNVPAATFRIYQATSLGKILADGDRVLSGYMAVDEFHKDPKFSPFISIVAEGPKGDIRTELIAGGCKDEPEAVCVGVSWMRGAGNTKRSRFGASHAQGKEIPVRIEVVNPRQWRVTLGDESATLNLSHPVKELQLKCVGVKGRIRLEPGPRTR